MNVRSMRVIGGGAREVLVEAVANSSSRESSKGGVVGERSMEKGA